MFQPKLVLSPGTNSLEYRLVRLLSGFVILGAVGSCMMKERTSWLGKERNLFEEREILNGPAMGWTIRGTDNGRAQIYFQYKPPIVGSWQYAKKTREGVNDAIWTALEGQKGVIKESLSPYVAGQASSSCGGQRAGDCEAESELQSLPSPPERVAPQKRSSGASTSIARYQNIR